MEAEPLDATGARFPAVRLWMFPRYPRVNMEALRRASREFRAAHPELDLPFAFAKPDDTSAGLPEGRVMIPRSLLPRPPPLCGSIYGARCSMCTDSTVSTRCYSLCARELDHDGRCCCFKHALMLQEWEAWERRAPWKEQTRGAEEAAVISLSANHWVGRLVDSDDSEAGYLLTGTISSQDHFKRGNRHPSS